MRTRFENRWIAVLALLLAPLALGAQTVAVSAAAFEAGRPVAPGSIVALFGDFPVNEPQVAGELPLPTQLGGVQVLVAGQTAGLYAVFPTQINFMVPMETPAAADASTVDIAVESEGVMIAQTALIIRDVSPAIFTLDAADAFRPGAVLNQDDSVNGPNNPAQPGEVLQIFGMGQGSKLISPAEVLPPITSVTPIVWFRTWPSAALASALPTGLPGMWQINAAVPKDTDLPSGPSPIVITADGVQSNTVTVWIEP